MTGYGYTRGQGYKYNSKKYKGINIRKYSDGSVEFLDPTGGNTESSKGGFTAAKKYIDKVKKSESRKKRKKSKSIFDMTINDLF